MGRPNKSKRSEASLLKRCDPIFIDLFKDMKKSGSVATFPEFTRLVHRELAKTNIKELEDFPRFFK